MTRWYRRGPGTLYRKLKSIEFLFTRDRAEVMSFLTDPSMAEPAPARLSLLAQYVHTTNHVRGYHTLGEMLRVAQAILRRSGRAQLTVVEAGAGLGASTAKLSRAVARAGGRLLVYDSFRGIPPNDEVHRSLDGRPVIFRAGAFTGRLGAVRRVVERYGVIDVCEFHKGWFEETLVGFDRPGDVALLDVDLVASTRTCLTALYPYLKPDGVLFSQDGHLEATVELMRDGSFWASLGGGPPTIQGLGTEKLIEVTRSDSPSPIHDRA